MQRPVYIVCLLMIFFSFSGCIDNETPAAEEQVMVNLRLSIAQAEPAGLAKGAETRATKTDIYYNQEAETEAEKMHQLRIIVVRPDGRVEYNSRLDFSTALTKHEETIQVIGGETKRIYLIVNEDTPLLYWKSEATSAMTTQYDFSETHFPIGGMFLEDEVGNLLLALNDGVDTTLPTPLPMSECHEVEVPQTDHEATLFVTRAAVKFTYTIKNRSSKALTLEEIGIDKMARKEYLFPKNTVYINADGSTNDVIDITQYEVPTVDNNEYYTFTKTYSGTETVTVDNGAETTLPSFYLLEGKYNDEADATKKYSTYIKVNGAKLEYKFLENLPQLPRNTWVKVNVTIGNAGTATWEVDLVPYTEITLEPGFGL